MGASVPLMLSWAFHTVYKDMYYLNIAFISQKKITLGVASGFEESSYFTFCILSADDLSLADKRRQNRPVDQRQPGDADGHGNDTRLQRPQRNQKTRGNDERTARQALRR